MAISPSSLSSRRLRDGRPDLLVIPESTLPIHWQASDRLRRDFGSIASRGPMILFNDFEEENEETYYNVARLLTKDGLAGAPYRKVHLVPFGEYVPLPRLFFFVRRISTAIGEFTPAPAPVLLRSGPVGDRGRRLLRDHLSLARRARRSPTARTCSRPSPTIPGTAEAERRSSTSPAR